MSVRCISMNRLVGHALPAFALCLLTAAPAYAVQRTFVSANGVDNPACSLAAPCRQFSAAVSATDPQGEVIVLDSGGYGPVTITQSVSIIAPQGVYAGITVFSGNGVVVGGAGIKVVLRGLSINGQGGNSGIFYTFANELVVERCAISNMMQDGVRIAWGAEVTIVDSVIRNNVGDGISVTLNPRLTVLRSRIEQNQGFGIFFAPTVVGATLSIIDAYVASNFFGIFVNPQSIATTVAVTGTTYAGNAGTGIAMQTEGDSGAITLEARNNTVVHNERGITAVINVGNGSISALLKDNLVARNSIVGILSNEAGTLVVIDGNTVTHNGFGIETKPGGLMQTRSNNTVRQNGTNVVGGAPTPVPAI